LLLVQSFQVTLAQLRSAKQANCPATKHSGM
jgi:hypothetical protein